MPQSCQEGPAVRLRVQLLQHAPGTLLDDVTDGFVAAGEKFACGLVENDLAGKDRERRGHPREVFIPGHLRAAPTTEGHRWSSGGAAEERHDGYFPNPVTRIPKLWR